MGRMKMEFQSSMFWNFATIGGTVAEMEEAIGEVIRERRSTFKNMIQSRFDSESAFFRK